MNEQQIKPPPMPRRDRFLFAVITMLVAGLAALYLNQRSLAARIAGLERSDASRLQLYRSGLQTRRELDKTLDKQIDQIAHDASQALDEIRELKQQQNRGRQ